MNIKELRKNKGLTQQDLADKIGMSVVSINRMENGKQPISKTVELAIQKGLEQNPELDILDLLKSNLNVLESVRLFLDTNKNYDRIDLRFIEQQIKETKQAIDKLEGL